MSIWELMRDTQVGTKAPLHNNQVSPRKVQERLGHSKMSTTMDLYSHVMPSMQKDAVERFDVALKEGSEV